MIGYYPIITNELCMQCHGQTGQQISPGTLAKITALYPNDKAVNYKVNQLRGIWVVEMKRDTIRHQLSDEIPASNHENSTQVNLDTN